MKQSNEKFEKPVLLKEGYYATAGDEHCKQIKDECSPKQMKP